MNTTVTAMALACGALLASGCGCSPAPPTAPDRPTAGVHDGKTVSEWAGVLKDGTAEERARAAKVLDRVVREARAKEHWGETPRSVEFDADVPTFLAVLKDGDRECRQVAALALEVAGPKAKEAVPALRDALAAEHKVFQDVLERRRGEFYEAEAILRYRLVGALGAIGQDAKEALPQLLDLVLHGDDKGGFRSALFSAITHIDPTGEESVPVYEKWLRESNAMGAHMLGATAESYSVMPKLNLARLRQSVPLLEKATAAEEGSVLRREAAGALKAVRQIPK